MPVGQGPLENSSEIGAERRRTTKDAPLRRLGATAPPITSSNSSPTAKRSFKSTLRRPQPLSTPRSPDHVAVVSWVRLSASLPPSQSERLLARPYAATRGPKARERAARVDDGSSLSRPGRTTQPPIRLTAARTILRLYSFQRNLLFLFSDLARHARLVERSLFFLHQ